MTNSISRINLPPAVPNAANVARTDGAATATATATGASADPASAAGVQQREFNRETLTASPAEVQRGRKRLSDLIGRVNAGKRSAPAEAVEQGNNVNVVDRSYGGREQSSVKRLKKSAVDGADPASAAGVLQGKSTINTHATAKAESCPKRPSNWGDCMRQAKAGGNVAQIVRENGVDGGRLRSVLEVASVNGPAGVAVGAGENVQSAAERFGITLQRQLENLQYKALNGVAGDAVLAGHNVEQVAQWHGIDHNPVVSRLRDLVKARDAVFRGEDMQRVAARHLIPVERLELLERDPRNVAAMALLALSRLEGKRR